VTLTGPLGFQVSVLGSYPRDTRLMVILATCRRPKRSLTGCARSMRAGLTSRVPEHSPRPRWEMDVPRTDDLIDRNHVLIAAATKARSDVIATLLKAERGREQARITGTVLNLPIAIFHRRKERPHA
jgi:hypothetical protein